MLFRPHRFAETIALAAIFALTASPAVAAVLPVPTVRVSGPTIVRSGRAFTAQGTADNGVVPGEAVVVTLKRRSGSDWVAVGSYAPTTTASGAFSVRIGVPSRGRWRVDAELAPTAEHEAATGHSKSFKAVGAKVVALTFDDGPWRGSTDKIISALKRYDAGATFFMLGSQVRGQSARAKAVVSAGNEAGVHSWNHANMARRSGKTNTADLKRSKATLAKSTGVTPVWFRPPYGSTSATLRRTASGVGLRQVIWTADTLDWRYRNASSITSRALKGARPGAVILMHDGGGNRSATVAAVPRILKALDAKGYDFVTLSELSALGYKIR
jgi:peptidoglycan/xylan/chitin deacetylase (PgdA/CDA1 family)